LQFNLWERLVERSEFIKAGLYASP